MRSADILNRSRFSERRVIFSRLFRSQYRKLPKGPLMEFDWAKYSLFFHIFSGNHWALPGSRAASMPALALYASSTL